MPRKQATSESSQSPKKARKPLTVPSSRGTGRPSIRTPETAQMICERLAKGESLVKITSSENMPCYSAVQLWLQEDPAFLVNYVRAREAQAEYYAQQIIDIADDGSNDTYVDEDGKTRTDYDSIARSKLRVDARKWIAAKLLPKKYGDKQEVEMTVDAGKSVLEVADRIRGVSPLLAARIPAQK